jgi:endoglucanase
MLRKIDRCVRWGEEYGLHVCLNLHRAPGYSVNPEKEEPYNLWKDPEALQAFVFLWEHFTRRYEGISSERVSFDLVNEPPAPDSPLMTREDHERVIRTTVEAIWTLDPKRRLVIDGLAYGTEPCPELADLGVGQSCRGYAPMGLSHYRAGWIEGSDGWPEPTWPGALHEGSPWDRSDLEAFYQPWLDLVAQGVGVHCGELGAFAETPHAVVLAWLRDLLEILTAHNIGWALWNFRDVFGVMDSNRPDVDYEDWHGHQLDREMVSLLQEF